GRLQIGTNRYGFTGHMNLQCEATNFIRRKHELPLSLQLRVGTNDQIDQIFGSLSDGTWTATLSGDRARFNARTNPAPCAGSYTLLFPGPDADPFVPSADGFGSARVNSNGVVLLSATLGDGAR